MTAPSDSTIQAVHGLSRHPYGVVAGLFRSGGHNYFGRHGREAGEHAMEMVDNLDLVRGRGITGDRFFNFKPDYKGQITFFDLEVWSRLQTDLSCSGIHFSRLRRNVFLEGVDVASCIGCEFEIQGIRFEGVEECRPCYWMDAAIGSGAESWLRGRGGVRARIRSDGVIRLGPARFRRI